MWLEIPPVSGLPMPFAAASVVSPVSIVVRFEARFHAGWVVGFEWVARIIAYPSVRCW